LALEKDTYTKKYQPPYDDPSPDGYVKQETEKERKKIFKMIIARLFMRA
jgi:hypothetical protein